MDFIQLYLIVNIYGALHNFTLGILKMKTEKKSLPLLWCLYVYSSYIIYIIVPLVELSRPIWFLSFPSAIKMQSSIGKDYKSMKNDIHISVRYFYTAFKMFIISVLIWM